MERKEIVSVLVVLLFVLRFAPSGQAQTDTLPWCPPGAQWVYVGVPSFQHTIKFVLTYDRDTVLDGKVVKVLRENRVHLTKANFDLPFVLVSNTFTDRYTYEEDRKVYWWMHDQFVLLFDRDAQKGSSWHIPAGEGYFTDPFYGGYHCDSAMAGDSIIVDSIGSGPWWQPNPPYDELFYTRSYFKRWNYGYPVLKLPTDYVGIVSRSYGPYEYPFFSPYRDETDSCKNVIFDIQAPTLDCYSDNVRGVVRADRSNGDCKSLILSVNQSEDLPDYNDLRIFPNPTNSQIFVQVSYGHHTLSSVTIYDMQGRLVMQQLGAASNQLDVSQLPAGMYIMQIKIEDSPKVITEKFMKYD